MADGEDRAFLACLVEALTASGVDLSGIELGPAHSLDGDLGVDSFQLMQVARHLEKAYDFRFSVADWVLEEDARDEPAYTVGALMAFAETQLHL